MPDVRVCFVGDSFVAGVGDPEHRGWVGRVCARSAADGRPLTAYNLGVRAQTSADVLARWRAECGQRLSADWDSRVVVSLGVNDTTIRDGRRRVPRERSPQHLTAILDGARGAGWPVLVVGPPPVADSAQNERLAELDTGFAGACAGRGVPYVRVLAALAADPVWMQEVAAGDGAHPAAAGYRALADLVWPRWSEWTGAPTVAHR
jgi:acyl-CoA thioesterase-1